MVKFGERLPKLMHRGWEQFYIDYEALKKAIEGADTKSDAFVKHIEKEIRKMDKFVLQRSKELGKAFSAAGRAPKALTDVQRDLATLRRFVGTNVIAATKIVKKHDKNVPADSQKREHVATLIRGCSGISAVLAFQRDFEAAMKKMNLQRPSPAGVQWPSLWNDPEAGVDDEADTETVRVAPAHAGLLGGRLCRDR